MEWYQCVGGTFWRGDLLIYDLHLSPRWHLLLNFVFYLSLVISWHTLYLEPQGSFRCSDSLAATFVALLGERKTFCGSLMPFWGVGRLGMTCLHPSCCAVTLLLCGEQLLPGKQALDPQFTDSLLITIVHHFSPPSGDSVTNWTASFGLSALL